MRRKDQKGLLTPNKERREGESVTSEGDPERVSQWSTQLRKEEIGDPRLPRLIELKSPVTTLGREIK